MKYFILICVMCFSISSLATATIIRETVLELTYDQNSMEYYVGSTGKYILEIQRGAAGGSYPDLDKGKVRNYSTDTDKMVYEVPFSLGSMRNSVLLADGSRLFIDHQGNIGKYDFSLNKAVHLKPAMPELGDYDDAYNLNISKDEKLVFVTKPYSTEVTVFDVTTLELLRKFNVAVADTSIISIDDIDEIAFQGKRALAVAIAIDTKEEPVDYNGLVIMDVESGEQLQTILGKNLGLKMRPNFNRRPFVSPLGDNAIFCDAVRGCVVVNLQTKKISKFFMKDGSNNGSAIFSPDGKLIYLQENEKLKVIKANNFSAVSSNMNALSLANEAILLKNSNTVLVEDFYAVYIFTVEGKLVAKVSADVKDEYAFIKDVLVLEDRKDGVKLMLTNSDKKAELVEVKY